MKTARLSSVKRGVEALSSWQDFFVRPTENHLRDATKMVARGCLSEHAGKWWFWPPCQCAPRSSIGHPRKLALIFDHQRSLAWLNPSAPVLDRRILAHVPAQSAFRAAEVIHRQARIIQRGFVAAGVMDSAVNPNPGRRTIGWIRPGITFQFHGIGFYLAPGASPEAFGK